MVQKSDAVRSSNSGSGVINYAHLRLVNA